MLAPSLILLGRREVARALDRLGPSLMALIEAAYLSFGAGRAVNPHSLFLLPPDRSGRIIALPAAVFDERPTMGIKWISSFPANLSQGLDRASAVIVVNDPRTGYPLAVMEGALISAWRTALSAALACRLMSPGKAARSVALIGCGVIARTTLEALTRDGWRFEEICLYDQTPEHAGRLADQLGRERTVVCDTAEAAVARAGVVVFATTAGTPWFSSAGALGHNPVILHLSLRDLDPALILASQNFTDDIEHAMRAATSLELAGLAAGNADFVAGDMCALINGGVKRDENRPAVFSPFGLGTLDIALAGRVVELAVQDGAGVVVDDFYAA
jgi:ornithine cyclodeaminase